MSESVQTRSLYKDYNKKSERIKTIIRKLDDALAKYHAEKFYTTTMLKMCITKLRSSRINSFNYDARRARVVLSDYKQLLNFFNENESLVKNNLDWFWNE